MEQVSHTQTVRRRKLAAQYLRMLLGERGEYRSLWARLIDKTGTDEISQAAVAKVMVEHQRKAGHAAAGLDYRLLKDRVHRALSGRALTPTTLGLFTAAFQFSEQDARQLWGLFLGTSPEQAEEVLDVPDTVMVGLSFGQARWLKAQLGVLCEQLGGAGAEEDLAVAEAIIGRLAG